MRKALLIICFLTLALPCFSEDYYVYIDKIGIVAKGEEAGHNEYGDVVGVYPYTKQYKPTRAELGRYKIVVMDLTELETQILTEPEYDKSPVNDVTAKILRARKRKLDIDNLSEIKQEEVVSDKTIVLKEFILKPSLISVIE